METIASLVVLFACVAAIARWVAIGSDRISHAGEERILDDQPLYDE